MIYDKTEVYHWTEDEQNFGKYDEGDVAVSVDPQGRLGSPTYLVSQIFPDSGESIHQRGVFWDKLEAERYAEKLDDDGEVVRPEGEDQYTLRSEVVMDARPVEIPPGSREVEVEYQKTKRDRDGHLKAIVSFLEPTDG